MRLGVTDNTDTAISNLGHTCLVGGMRVGKALEVRVAGRLHAESSGRHALRGRHTATTY